MKNFIFLLFALIFSGWLGCTPTEPKVNIPSSATRDTEIVDSSSWKHQALPACIARLNLDSLPTLTSYQRYDDRDKIETVEDASGVFGVYFVNAMFDFKTSRNSCCLNYHLKQESYGEWISIRREFVRPVNLKSCNGIELRVKVVKPSTNTRLRLTICDGTSESDEMHCYTPDPRLLGSAKGWVTLNVPFSKFNLANFQGARHNDYELDLTHIIAYEINVLSPSRKEAKGKIEFSEPRVY